MSAELMSSLGPAGTAVRCPGCGSGHTTWVRAETSDNLLCKTCGTCWHEADGHIGPVEVAECPGCALHGICLAAHG